MELVDRFFSTTAEPRFFVRVRCKWDDRLDSGVNSSMSSIEIAKFQ